MLSMPIDRVVELLEKAEEVEVPATIIAEGTVELSDDDIATSLEEVLADDPAYEALAAAVESLVPQELLELIALSLLNRNAAEIEQWPAMLEEARGVAVEDASGTVIATLLLTDDIEQALDRIGYIDSTSEDESEEAADESAEEEEGADEEDGVEEEEGEAENRQSGD